MRLLLVAILYSYQHPYKMKMEDAIREKYEKSNQGHVFQFYHELNEADQNHFCHQLSAIDPEWMNRIYETAQSQTMKSLEGEATQQQQQQQKEEEEESILEPLAEDWIASTAHLENVKIWYHLGLDLIRQGKVAVMTLAGGQGTRLGSTAPKGTYDIGLPSHKSLFQLQAERLLRLACLSQTAPCPQLASSPEATAESTTSSNGLLSPQRQLIDWYIMTSDATHEATESFFKEHHYFGYDPSFLYFFKQGSLPAFSSGAQPSLSGEKGAFLLELKGRLATSPDGNGGLFRSFMSPELGGSGLLERMQRRGTPHLHVYCVDNVLARVGDPVFIGYSASKELEIGCKAVEKTKAEESVGVICLRNGQPVVVEYSEMSQSHRNLRDAQGRLVYRFGNIANHYFSVPFLSRLLSTPLAQTLKYHIAHKKIPHIDLSSGQLVKPTTNNGVKLELFIFDIFPCAKRLGVLLVDRAEEFSPLKNAPGSGIDCPETSRADLLSLHEKYLKEAGYPFYHQCGIELSPFITYGGEGLPCLKDASKELPKSIQHINDLR